MMTKAAFALAAMLPLCLVYTKKRCIVIFTYKLITYKEAFYIVFFLLALKSVTYIKIKAL